MCSSLFASRNAIKSNISLSKGLKLSNLEIYHLLLKNISTILNKWTIFGSEKSHRSTPSKISYFPPLVHDSIILVSSCEETRVDSCVTSAYPRRSFSVGWNPTVFREDRCGYDFSHRIAGSAPRISRNDTAHGHGRWLMTSVWYITIIFHA